HLAGSFKDTRLPTGYAPYSIQNIGGKLFVTYAKRDAAKDGGFVEGQGKGFVDVYSSSGQLLQRIASRGALNAPSSVVMAPPGFRSVGADLLIATAGRRRIGASNPPPPSASRGVLRGSRQQSIAIAGLKALRFGNGVSAGDANALYFTAAPNKGKHGLFG